MSVLDDIGGYLQGITTGPLSYLKEAAVGAAQPFYVKPLAVTPKTTFAQQSYNNQVAPIVNAGESLVSGVSGLYNLGAAAVGAPQAGGKWLDGVNADVNSNLEDLRSQMGAPAHPGDPGYMAANIVGSLLIPGPKGVGVLKVGEDAGRVAKIAASTANTAIEGVIPLRQNGLLHAVATQLPIGLGLNAGATALYDGQHKAAAQAQYAGMTIKDFMSPEVQTAYNGAVAVNDTDTQNHIAGLVDSARLQWLDANGIGSGTAADTNVPLWKNPIVVGSALAIAAIGAGVTPALLRQTKLRLQEGNPNLAGIQTVEGASGPVTKTAGYMVQHDQPVRSMNAVISGDSPTGNAFTPTSTQTKLANAALDRVAPASQASIVRNSFATGEMPKSTVTMPAPLSSFLEAHAQLDPASQQVLRNGLLANTALDDFKRTGELSAFAPTETDNLAGITVQDRVSQLEDMVKSLDSSPQLSSMGDMVKKFYRSGLDFAVDRGLIEPSIGAKFATDRPNYVQLASSIRQDDTPRLFLGDTYKGGSSPLLEQFLAREGGLQAGQVTDPIRSMPTYLAGIIHKAEVNDAKIDFFDRATVNDGASQFVKEVGADATGDNVHTVYNGGKTTKYEVSDNGLSSALNLNPAAAGPWLRNIVSAPKRLYESQVTGALSMFSGIAPAYATLSSMMLRPDGYNLGIFNSMIQDHVRLGPMNLNPLSGLMGALDPTTWGASAIGATRILWDKAIEGMSSNLMQKIHLGLDPSAPYSGPASMIFGNTTNEAMAAKLNSMYSDTLTSHMDSLGASNSGFLGQHSDLALSTGMEDLAPHFNANQNMQIFNEALAGGAKLPTLVGAAAKAAGSAIMTAPVINHVSSLYMALTKALHDGNNYQAFATNISRASGDPLMEQLIASQTRRLGGDLTQKGSSGLATMLGHIGLYFNPALQGLSEVVRKGKDQPITTLSNFASTLGVATAAQYATLANDPQALDRYRAMSDAQRGRTIVMPFGIDFPVRPEFRMLWAPFTVLMDQVTGVNTGPVNPHIADAMQRWYETGMDEQSSFSLGQRFSSAVDAANPINIGASPWTNAIAAANGIDTGMSRYTDTPQSIHGSKIDPGATDQNGSDALMSARAEMVVHALLGPAVESAFQAAADYNHSVMNGGDWKEQMRVAANRFSSDRIKSSGMFRGTLFKDTPELQGINRPQDALWFQQDQGIKTAITALDAEKRGFMTSGDPRYAQVADVDIQLPQYQGTAAGLIGGAASSLDRSMTPLRKELEQWNAQAKTFIPSKAHETQDQKTVDLNIVNAHRRDIIERMQSITNMATEQIRTMIGDPKFNFQNYKINDYIKMPASQQQTAAEWQSEQNTQQQAQAPNAQQGVQ